MYFCNNYFIHKNFFNFFISYKFSNGLYAPDKEISRDLIIIITSVLPCSILTFIILYLSVNLKSKKSFKTIFILLIIKILLFAIYFIFLYIDRKTKIRKILLITLILEFYYYNKRNIEKEKESKF